MYRLVVFAVQLALAVGAAAQASMRAEPSAQQKQVITDFKQRVDDYVRLRNQQPGGQPKPTSSPEKIVASEKEVAARVRSARGNAKQGDIFTPEIAAYFRSRIAATLKGTQGVKVRASLKHSEPVHAVRLQVNGEYPQKLPLQSTPPSLLANLPQLPKGLEYRIVNHDLVLYDSVPALIVDFVPNAIAAP